MTYVLKDPLTTLERCPQCAVAKPNLQLKSVILGPHIASHTHRGWAIYQCASCLEAVCFRGRFHAGDGFRSSVEMFAMMEQFADEVMPAPSDDFSDWPERAKRYMTQAIEALAAPDGAVMLAGSAVDAMLKEKGLIKGTVHARINEAVSNHLLTEAMGEWAHAVRLSANNPRHADLDAPHATTEEARATIDFAKALGQFLFVLPARIERGKEAAQIASEGAGAGSA